MTNSQVLRYARTNCWWYCRIHLLGICIAGIASLAGENITQEKGSIALHAGTHSRIDHGWEHHECKDGVIWSFPRQVFANELEYHRELRFLSNCSFDLAGAFLVPKATDHKLAGAAGLCRPYTRRKFGCFPAPPYFDSNMGDPIDAREF